MASRLMYAARAGLDELAQVVAVPGLVFEQRPHEELGASFLALGVSIVESNMWEHHILHRTNGLSRRRVVISSSGR